MQELQQAIAERRVERLAYRGMRDLSEWINSTLGFVLVADPQHLKAIERFVEQRNLIVHKRGVIDRRYLARMGVEDGQIGEPLKVGGQSVDALALMERSVVDADARASKKWSLRRFPFDVSAARPRRPLDSPGGNCAPNASGLIQVAGPPQSACQS
jgi:hypothetical protein